MENASQENGRKNEKKQVAHKGESSALHLEAGDYCVQFGVRQAILQCRWGVIQRLAEPQARMREEKTERLVEEVRQLMQKLRGK